MATIPNPGHLRDLDHPGLVWAVSCLRCRRLFTAVYHSGGYVGDSEARHDCQGAQSAPPPLG